MASDYSTYLGNKVIRWLAGQTMPSAPASIWCALFNGDPKAGGTDVTATIRAAGRVQIAVTAPASGTTNTMSNDSDVDFGDADGAATVTHMAVYDASSSGNFLGSKSVGSNSITAGELVKFLTGDITFTVGS